MLGPVLVLRKLMIKEIRLTNFRCFEDHTLIFRPMSIIVGANNAGKSTIIEAIRILSLVVTRYGSLNFQEVPSWLKLPRVFRGVSPSLKGIEFNSLSIFHNLGNSPAIISAVFESGMKVEVYIGPDAALHAIITTEKGKIITNKSSAQNHPLPSIAILPQIAPLSREEVILDPEYARRVISSSWASLYFRNQIHLYPKYFDEFKKLSESTWTGLRILKLVKKSSNPHEPIGLLIQDHDFVAEIAWTGHGLQMWLQTMWFLARSNGSDTIILDEPDVYMHADLQRKLIRLLKGRHSQVIVATHSVEIMAEVEARDVLIVNRRADRSIYAASIPSVQEVIDNIGGVHNLQLARLWNSRRCLLVEGKDIAFLKQIQNILFPKSREALDTIPNIPLGGWGGWNYAIGSKLLLKNAVGEDIRTYCIFDSDFHTPEEIQARYEQAQERGVELHIWRRKEIENYFIVPSTIQRIIASENRKNESSPSEGDIETELNGIVESIKDSVFDSLSVEYHTQNKAGGVAEANKRARKKLDEAWKIPEGRWSLASGKGILSSLSRWSQGKFGVGLSPMKIAREMRRDEVDPELSYLVMAIERGISFKDLGL